ncbi:hypothetical protein COLO4_05470 [Corchorus olitorius]|uniref:Uncharacterized protein n=1 Tax=Corchorus olitorius TaxID=93759 RepID=A0A1R3KQS1_9ROSI|nr:hypothetical protein COLO4_05470 [Corchorus olitorius]
MENDHRVDNVKKLIKSGRKDKADLAAVRDLPCVPRN